MVASKIDLYGDENLFCLTAEKWAVEIAGEASGNKNAYSQTRKFYDEFIHYRDMVKTLRNSSLGDTSVNKSAILFKNTLPLIKMINAKAAYAKARGKVTDSFVKMYKDVIECIRKEDDLERAATFLEAFMAYYKGYARSN